MVCAHAQVLRLGVGMPAARCLSLTLPSLSLSSPISPSHIPSLKWYPKSSIDFFPFLFAVTAATYMGVVTLGVVSYVDVGVATCGCGVWLHIWM